MITVNQLIAHFLFVDFSIIGDKFKSKYQLTVENFQYILRMSASTPPTNAGIGEAGISSEDTRQLAVIHKQLMELSTKFRTIVQEAKTAGETSPRGKTLLIEAAKIKQVYDNLNKQRQQLQSQLSTTSNVTSSTANANPGSSNDTATDTTASSSNQLAALIRRVLTPEQNSAYEKMTQNLNSRFNSIREKHTFLKQNIHKLTLEINKQQEEVTKRQLNDKRNELLNNIRALNVEQQQLKEEAQNAKKNFYVECARQNTALQKVLQKHAQQQKAMRQEQLQKTQAFAQSQNLQKPQESNTLENPPSQSTAQAGSESGSNDQHSVLDQTGSGQSSKEAKVSSQVTNVNATASNANKTSSNKLSIFKQSDPSIAISESVSVPKPTPVAYTTNRPTITGGSAMNASAINIPAASKLPPYELDTERVLSKRKLSELVKSIGIDEGDGETGIDGDVEELLLDMADEFVTNVTAFACRLAKHRKSDNLEARDLQLHLERNWNIRIPGYAADEIRSTRKWNPSQAYNQKIQSISSDKNAHYSKIYNTSGNSSSKNKNTGSN